MGTKINSSANYKNNLSFSDYFQEQNRTVVLLTHYCEEHSYYDSINSLLIEKLINLDLQHIPWEELTERIKPFFIDLNWELHAVFNKESDVEKGLSLLLMVIEGNRLFYVSFGRFLCMLLSQKNTEWYSEDWSNSRVKTPEQLGLLGSLQQDISVKPLIINLKEGSQFIAVSSDIIKRIDFSSLNIYNSKSYLENQFEKKPYSYSIVSHSSNRSKQRKSWLKGKKFRLTALALLLMLAFSLYYTFMGKNTVEDRLHITREQFQLTVRNIDILKIQEMIPLDYGLLFVPQENIELFVEWESVLPFQVTLTPNYDMRFIFLSSNNKLYAYEKKDKKNRWMVSLPNDIYSIEILDANLMVATTVQNQSFCLKRDTGDIIWHREGIGVSKLGEESRYKPVQISLEMDRRLNNTVVLFPDKRSLTLLNLLNGDTLYHYESDYQITFVSDFDFIDKSVYIVKSNKLYKIRIDIRS